MFFVGLGPLRYFTFREAVLGQLVLVVIGALGRRTAWQIRLFFSLFILRKPV